LSSSTRPFRVEEDKPVTVKLLGGDLQILWNRQENLVYMTGPATTVFDGEIFL
ncbi:diaminopimelate epimerase, partial [Blautia schinkii]|nr:diaminopimelate epimerase [Blautia schinkii]